MLAGMISSPSAYSPRANPEAALARRNLVLQKMVEQGYINRGVPRRTRPGANPMPSQSEIQPPTEDSAAPYFTSWLRQQVVDCYGAGEAFGGGLQVHSTLDLDLQRAGRGDRLLAARRDRADRAVVVLDNDTAGVRAMVGGSDYASRPFNLATNGHRQPGSSFKPFTLVTRARGGALARPRSSARSRSSSPSGRSGVGGSSEMFEVNNYDDAYLGSASLATATTYSDNSVYAELGLKYAGGAGADRRDRRTRWAIDSSTLDRTRR